MYGTTLHDTFMTLLLIEREIYLNRRLGPNCLVGTWFQLSTPHSLVVIPNRQADTTIST